MISIMLTEEQRHYLHERVQSEIEQEEHCLIVSQETADGLSSDIDDFNETSRKELKILYALEKKLRE